MILRVQPLRLKNKSVKMVATTTTASGRPRGPQCGQEVFRVPPERRFRLGLMDCLICKLPFFRLVREITQNLNSRTRGAPILRMQENAFATLQQFTYSYFTTSDIST